MGERGESSCSVEVAVVKSGGRRDVHFPCRLVVGQKYQISKYPRIKNLKCVAS